ncbi:MAG: DUF2057 domain-containing protein [Gammaproteobacteria bacterium]|uniref:DUF2057 domain-containing protein n=1 Tax=Marinobacter litoralis TaxID=187981 RepID=A0A3M2R973_9GAMM|nr:DUF2057 family protein [Marinobacter litoralis]MBR9872063.1 DUF2057 domain-containing protein [Gammaproteobacteria bacterium]RMJ01838.1 hypothetical protein DOQ08_03117 [Marinobacter litoralis]
MSMCHVGGFYKLVLAFLTVLVAGCASSLSRVDTWEGSLPAATEPAVLKAPGTIQVSEVNGKSMTSFLMDDLALDYGLLPGGNEVVFTYKTIWAKSGIVEDGESKVHVIETEPQVVRFDAEPGATYQFAVEKPESRRAAEAFSKNFSATIVNTDGDAVAEAAVWKGPADNRTPVFVGGESGYDGEAGNTLENMKRLWGEATDEEKKTFLRWAFE